jgi:hypothetical protein
VVTVGDFANLCFHRSTVSRLARRINFLPISMESVLQSQCRSLGTFQYRQPSGGKGTFNIRTHVLSGPFRKRIAHILLRLKPAVYAPVTHTSRFGLGGLGAAARSYG